MATTHVAALVIEMVDVEDMLLPGSHAYMAMFGPIEDERYWEFRTDPREVCVSWFSSDLRFRSAWFTRSSLAPILFPEEG